MLWSPLEVLTTTSFDFEGGLEQNLCHFTVQKVLTQINGERFNELSLTAPKVTLAGTYRTRFYFASTTFICITYMVLLSYFIHKIQCGYRYMPKIHPGKCGFHSTYSMRFCFTQSTTQTSLSYHISKLIELCNDERH